jgi:hypothetical protein
MNEIIATFGIFCMAVAFFNAVGIGPHPPKERGREGYGWYQEQSGMYKVFLTTYILAVAVGYLEIMVVLGISAWALITYIT